MAAPIKAGLDYFPLEVGIFVDTKVMLVSAEFGYKAQLVLVHLLIKIYREHGYYMLWNEDTALLLATEVFGGSVKGPFVCEVVNGLVRREFFNKTMYDRFGILTSKGIQKRYVLGKGRLRKLRELIDPKYSLLPAENVITGNNSVIACNNPVITGNNSVKKRKEKKSKVIPPLPPQGECAEEQTTLYSGRGDIIPVHDIITLWNDSWNGTPNVIRAFFLDGIQSERLQTLWASRHDLTEYETAFKQARREYDSGEKAFTLSGVLTEANFPRLLLNAARDDPRQHDSSQYYDEHNI